MKLPEVKEAKLTIGIKVFEWSGSKRHPAQNCSSYKLETSIGEGNYQKYEENHKQRLQVTDDQPYRIH